jgi:hypothetical protein
MVEMCFIIAIDDEFIDTRWFKTEETAPWEQTPFNASTNFQTMLYLSISFC